MSSLLPNCPPLARGRRSHCRALCAPVRPSLPLGFGSLPCASERLPVRSFGLQCTRVTSFCHLQPRRTFASGRLQTGKQLKHQMLSKVGRPRQARPAAGSLAQEGPEGSHLGLVVTGALPHLLCHRGPQPLWATVGACRSGWASRTGHAGRPLCVLRGRTGAVPVCRGARPRPEFPVSGPFCLNAD